MSLRMRMLADVAMRREDYVAAELRLQECSSLRPATPPRASTWRAPSTPSTDTPRRCRISSACLQPRRINIDYLNLKAQVLRLLGRTDEAIALMEAARRPSPARGVLLAAVRTPAARGG